MSWSSLLPKRIPPVLSIRQAVSSPTHIWAAVPFLFSLNRYCIFTSIRTGELGLAGTRICLQPRQAASGTFPSVTGAIEFPCGSQFTAWWLTFKAFRSIASSAQPLILNRHPQNWTTDNSGRPLFAPASSVRSRLKPERWWASGLRTTPCGFLRFPHANS